MSKVVTRKFISTGEIVNVNLGFVPAYAEIRNANATAGTVAKLVYFNQNGDAQEFWEYAINDQGTAVALNITKKSSSGYVSAYNTVSAIGKQMICTFDDTGGAAEDLITCSVAADLPANGQSVKFVAGGGLPTTAPTALLNYYVIDSGVYGAGTFRISLTPGGSKVNFGSDGTPTNYFVNVSEAEPCVTGGKGLTISASFSADSDVIYVLAVQSDDDKNLGDSAVW